MTSKNHGRYCSRDGGQGSSFGATLSRPRTIMGVIVRRMGDRVIFWVQPWGGDGCGQTTAAVVVCRIAGRNNTSYDRKVTTSRKTLRNSPRTLTRRHRLTSSVDSSIRLLELVLTLSRHLKDATESKGVLRYLDSELLIVRQESLLDSLSGL